MMVRVMFFASLREAVTDEVLELTLVEGATLGDLRAALTQRLDRTQVCAIEASDVRIAVNQDLLLDEAHDASVLLKGGDEVAFLPPVTGG